MLGTDLVAAFGDHDVIAPARGALDITDRLAVDAYVRNAGVDVVVNAAAHTRVDDAEHDEALAHRVNAEGAESLALASTRAGARFVQISTDYVFDGRASQPYLESDIRRPLSAYGRSKSEGERLVMRAAPDSHIVRTAWLYGAHGPNFARTILAAAETRETISVVTDQLGQPTWTMDLAATIASLVESAAPSGIYHATNSGHATWYEFARAVYSAVGLDPERVLPTTSAAFPRPAPRPAYSVLGDGALRKAGLEPMRSWQDALDDAVRHGVLATR